MLLRVALCRCMMGVQRGGEKVLIADAVIIGAGVIGLAIARELASYGLVPFILDKTDGFGTGTSSRSSEVIHAGIYYERSEEHTSELQSLMRISYAVFCLTKNRRHLQH